MTYLQLCRRLARACGMTASGTIPATVANQTGNLLDAVDWIADAYTELQNDRPWRWLRSKFSFSTVASQSEYAFGDCADTRLSATITRFSSWIVSDRRNPPKAYLTSSGVGGQYYLQFVDWETFQVIYGIGTVNEGPPAHITIDPQDNLVLGPTPNDAYTITGEYWMSAQILAQDADEPEMPSDYHMLIVYDAMRKYAGDQVAGEVMTRAVNEGGKLRCQLDANQLPGWRSPRPMA